MFRALSIIEDDTLEKNLRHILVASEHVRGDHWITSLPESPYDVMRALNSTGPEIVLLDASDPERALKAADLIRAHTADMPMVLITPSNPRQERMLEQAGYVTVAGSFSEIDINLAIRRAVYSAHKEPYANVFVFLPGKAGSGASTVSFNVAAALAKTGQTPLLLECDLHSGVLSVLMNVNPRRVLLDALQDSETLSSTTWSNYPTHVHGVDFLLADRVRRTPLPSWSQYHQLLRFTAPRYGAVVVDLPEVINDATTDLAFYATRTFVVSTPELLPLKLAAQRLKDLRDRGLDEKRIGVILNRWRDKDMKPSEAEQVLGVPISAIIPNDYRSVHHSVVSGAPVDSSSVSGKAFAAFAMTLERLASGTPEPVRESVASRLKSLLPFPHRAPRTT